MLVDNPREYLRYAYQKRFCMPAFNVCNLEMAKAVIEAATIEKAPLIVQTYPGDIEHGGLKSLSSVIKALAAETSVPVFLHLDHGPGFEFNLRCLREGYSSCMFDGFNLPFEEALKETALVARAAHALGAAVEGEVGSFGGGTEGQGHEIHLSDPEDVPRMFEAGADMLAVSVGSEHGKSTRLNLELLEAISKKANAPLVMHGGSGIHEDDVRAAVKLGVVKINIGAALSRAWVAGSKEGLEAGENHYGILKRSMTKVREVAQHRLRLMGAAGQA